MTPEEKRQFEQMRRELDNLKNYQTFPDDVFNSITLRLTNKDELISNMAKTGTGPASVTMEIVVPEGGSTFNVLAYPDGFRVFRILDKDYYFPYYTK